MRLKLASTVAAVALVVSGLTIASPAQAASSCTMTADTATCVFDYTGAAESWIVPPGVTEVEASVYGAEGGSIDNFTKGGLGGHATATLSVQPGTSILIAVGGLGSQDDGPGGFNGGGLGGTARVPGGGGGGATDIRIGGSALTDRALVAGGGGGATNRTIAGNFGNGGAGGGLLGLVGGPGGAGGSGGDQASGGSGILGEGSRGEWEQGPGSDGGGGGGGGYYGGAGGQAGIFTVSTPGAGGGGSGYGPVGTLFETGVRESSGQAMISYKLSTSETAVSANPTSVASGGLVNLSALVTSATPAANLSGTVEFFAGGASLGTATVVAGSAVLSVVQLSVGTHSITAIYSGNTVTAASSTTIPATVTVEPAKVAPKPTPSPTTTAPEIPERIETSVF